MMPTRANGHAAPAHPAPEDAPIASYMRVSTDEQRERATIETQRVEIAKYADAHRLRLATAYADDGWSGRKFHLHQRPDGARLLSDAASGQFQAIIVYRADRLGRGRKLLSAIDDLESAGVRYIVSVTEQTFDLKNSTDIFHLTMLSGVSGYESDGFMQRSGDAMNRLAAEGQWMGGTPPYGYRVEGTKRAARLIIADTPIPGLAVILSEADVVRLIFRRTVEDDWSAPRICDELDALGVPMPVRSVKATETGTPDMRRHARERWWPATVARMLRNPVYRGVHRYGKHTANSEGRAVIERAAPAIIDEQTWERAQAKLTRHKILSKKNAVHDYLLRGLMICGVCGLSYGGMRSAQLPTRGAQRAWRSMQAERVAQGLPPLRLADDPSARWHSYYRCTGHIQYQGVYGARGERCPSKDIPGEALDAHVWATIQAFARDPDAVLTELAAQLDTREEVSNRLRDRIADLKLAIGTKAAERDSILTLFRRGRIDNETLDRQFDTIEQEEQGLRSDLVEQEQIMAGLARAEEGMRSAETLLRTLQTQVDADLSFPEKRRIVETLVKRITINTIADPTTLRRRAVAHVEYHFALPQNTPAVALRKRPPQQLTLDTALAALQDDACLVAVPHSPHHWCHTYNAFALPILTIARQYDSQERAADLHRRAATREKSIARR